jgi:NADH-quinone oxidoreductase subunit L
MVTAGVYMIARLNFIFIQSPQIMTIVAFVGALTALYAAGTGDTSRPRVATSTTVAD